MTTTIYLMEIKSFRAYARVWRSHVSLIAWHFLYDSEFNQMGCDLHINKMGKYFAWCISINTTISRATIRFRALVHRCVSAFCLLIIGFEQMHWLLKRLKHCLFYFDSYKMLSRLLSQSRSNRMAWRSQLTFFIHT